MKVLVTGGAGFIGSEVRLELWSRKHEAIVLDSLTYAGRNKQLPPPSFFVQDDLRGDYRDVTADAVIHCAAETHVDRSFRDPAVFVQSNVEGTLNLLEWAREAKLKRFVHVSTDEVFGESSHPCATGDRLNPSNPYAATKAGAEYLVHSYHRSFGVPTVITRLCNVFGPRQHPEKFIPRLIGQLLRGEEVVIHTGPDGEPGHRRWVPVGVVSSALVDLAEGQVAAPGETVHVTEGAGYDNLQIATMIANFAGRPLLYRLEKAPRASYDADYRLAPSTDRWPWQLTSSFEKTLQQTVMWYLGHPEALAA